MMASQPQPQQQQEAEKQTAPEGVKRKASEASSSPENKYMWLCFRVKIRSTDKDGKTDTTSWSTAPGLFRDAKFVGAFIGGRPPVCSPVSHPKKEDKEAEAAANAPQNLVEILGTPSEDYKLDLDKWEVIHSRSVEPPGRVLQDFATVRYKNGPAKEGEFLEVIYCKRDGKLFLDALAYQFPKSKRPVGANKRINKGRKRKISESYDS
jgi:hypothetical protein